MVGSISRPARSARLALVATALVLAASGCDTPRRTGADRRADAGTFELDAAMPRDDAQVRLDAAPVDAERVDAAPNGSLTDAGPDDAGPGDAGASPTCPFGDSAVCGGNAAGGTQSTCTMNLRRFVALCEGAGWTWTGDRFCIVGGSPSSTTAYGGDGVCTNAHTVPLDAGSATAPRDAGLRPDAASPTCPVHDGEVCGGNAVGESEGRCNRALERLVSLCERAGWTWTGDRVCIPGGSPSSTTDYGGDGACTP